MRLIRTASMVITVVVLAGCTAAPTTTFTNSDGETVTLDWADYPGSAGTAAQELITAPPEEDVEDTSFALLGTITSRLTEEFGVTFTVEGDDGWHPSEGNGYGGESLLITYNSVGHTSATIPSTADDWRAIVDIVSEETVGSGLGELVLDHESESYLRDESWQDDDAERFGADDPDRFWSWSGLAYGSSQWLSLLLSDAERDPSGQALRDAEQVGYEPQSISLSYGATTVPAEKRAEFDRRIAPFIGLTPPPQTTSD